MTTIAYRDGVLASDSGVYDGAHDLMEGITPKVYQWPDVKGHWLFGAAGDADMRELIAILQATGLQTTKDEIATLDTEVDGILISPQGEIWRVYYDPENEESHIYPLNADFFAVGSGAQIAIGAMAAGKGAEEAIELTSHHNVHTRLPVQSVRLA